ncbi:hypothetical protein LEMLEM_LOCUS9264 [Lemmus lemmus]
MTWEKRLEANLEVSIEYFLLSTRGSKLCRGPHTQFLPQSARSGILPPYILYLQILPA